eukprot:g15586.t1
MSKTQGFLGRSTKIHLCARTFGFQRTGFSNTLSSSRWSLSACASATGDRPPPRPRSVGIFSFDDVKSIVEYATNSFFRHYRLYMYAFMTHCDVCLRVDPTVQPELAHLFRPSEQEQAEAEMRRIRSKQEPEDERSAMIKQRVEEGVKKLMEDFETKLKEQDVYFSCDFLQLSIPSFVAFRGKICMAEIVDVAAIVNNAKKADSQKDQVAKATAAADKIVRAPHPYPSKAIPLRALEEEDYAEAISALIERDFFPDLPHLRARYELMQARLRGDNALAKALEKKLLEMPRPTPGHTPRRSTPLPEEAELLEAAGGSRTSRMPDPVNAAAARLSAWEKDDGAESVASANAGSIANCQQVLLRLISGREVVVDLSTVRLDDFQQVFTSEDNASFEAVLDRDRERRRQKEWWVETSEEKHNTKCKAQALEFEETGQQFSEVLAKMVKEGTFSVAALHSYGHVRAVGGRLQTPMGPNSYPMVNTPALSPGEGFSPFMTFGKIASTPRVLDEETGPTFRVQDESARDRAAEKLAKGAMQKQRESRQNSKKERDLDVTPMTPIGQLLHRAQRMAQRGGRLRISTKTLSRPTPTPEGREVKRARTTPESWLHEVIEMLDRWHE